MTKLSNSPTHAKLVMFIGLRRICPQSSSPLSLSFPKEFFQVGQSEFFRIFFEAQKSDFVSLKLFYIGEGRCRSEGGAIGSWWFRTLNEGSVVPGAPKNYRNL